MAVDVVVFALSPFLLDLGAAECFLLYDGANAMVVTVYVLEQDAHDIFATTE